MSAPEGAVAEGAAAAGSAPVIGVDGGASPWQRTIQELDHLPAHDPRWDTVEEFIENLRGLAERKVEERRFARDLEVRIGRLGAHPKRPKTLALPSVSSLDVTLWSQLDELSEELLKRLDDLDQKFGAMSAATSDDVPRLLEETVPLSQQCKEMWERLSRLSGEAPATPTVSAPAPEAPLEGGPFGEAPEPVGALSHAPAIAQEEPQVAAPEAPTPAEPVDAAFPLRAEAGTVAETATQKESSADIAAPDSAAIEVVKAEAPRSDEVSVIPPLAMPEAPAEWVEQPTAGPASATALEVARQVLECPEDVGRRRALLDGLVAEGFWSEAYWLAYSLALDPKMSDELREPCSRLETLLNFLLATISLPESRAQALAVLHAAVVPVDRENERVLGFMIAIAGYPGTLAHPLGVWLEYCPKDSPSLFEVTEYLQRLRLELPVSTDDVSACVQMSARQKEIDALRVELDGWRREIPKHADWHVWSKLVFKDPRPLWTMVDSTLNSAANPSEGLLRDIRHLQDDGDAKKLVDDYDNAAYRQMHSSMVRNLCNEITDLADKCQRYLELVSADREARLKLTAELVKLAEFRRQIARTDESVVAELNRCIEASDTLAVRSAWLAGLRLWRWLTGVLDTVDSGRAPSPALRSLYLNRNAALALYPIDRDDLGGIDTEFLQDSQRIAAIFASDLVNPPATDELVKRIAGRGDFRFIEDLRAAVRQEQDEEAVVRDLEGDLQRMRAELAMKRLRAETAVTRAWALGFIDEVQKARFESIVGEVARQHAATRLLRPAQEALDQILTSLTEKESAWVQSLNSDLDSQIVRLREHHINEEMIAAVEAARRQVESRFPEPSQRCAALSDLLESARAAANDDTEGAVKKLAGIGSSALIPRHLKAFLSSKPRAPGAPWAAQWDGLPSAIKNAASEYAKRAHDVLRLIGIPEQQIRMSAARGKTYDYGDSRTGVCDILDVRAVVPSPIPQFGSGLTRLKVAIDTSPRGDLTSALTELAKLGEPTLPAAVLYFNRLEPEQRLVRKIAASLAPEAQRSPTVVIDRALWEYLEPFDRSDRLNVALQCTLPFTYANPFRAFGYVPKELFVGREREITDIAGDRGKSRLLYGGRQLGKSAILQEVQRRVESTEARGSHGARRSHCLLLDLRNKFRTQPPSNIWSEIRRAFAEKIRPKAAGSASPEATIANIKSWLEENPSNKLFVLADEADSFLRADARRAYEESSKIAALMRSTDDRFRMIFAGTIDVGRHAASKNAPLNEFGEPTIVLPALPRDARRMLEMPLAALGIDLDESDVYQILARTNYYPCLIQLIGEKIVELNADSTAPPPIRIASDRIAKLLEQDSVRRTMMERFGLTLGLTADYKCIIYSLVRKQSEAGLKAQPLLEDDIYQAAAEAWPRRFGKMPLNEFKVILRELVPMGVLVREQAGDGEDGRSADGRNQYAYRLRSPNLMPLLGSPADLAAELKGLERQGDDNLDDFHCYDKERGLFSPLSQAQETLITGESHRINMVLTPNASQWSALVESLRAYRDEQFDYHKEIPAEALTDYKSWYESEGIAKRTDATRITLIANFAGVERDSMPALLEALVPDPNLVRHRTVTFVVGLPGSAAIRYLSFDESQRAQWEKDRNLIAVRRWTLDQIRVALSDLELTAAFEVGERVEAVTGGWHFLLTQLFENWQRRQNLDQNVAAFSDKLAANTGEAFLASMGLEGKRYRQTVSLLHGEGYSRNVFDPARVAQDGADLFPGYEAPPDLRAFVEYLIHLDMAEVADGKIRVDPLTLRFCGAER